MNRVLPNHFYCHRCGKVEYALLDGYLIAEKQLEGILFVIRKSNNTELEALGVIPEHESRFNNFNTFYYISCATSFVNEDENQDTLMCPRCSLDLDPAETEIDHLTTAEAFPHGIADTPMTLCNYEELLAKYSKVQE